MRRRSARCIRSGASVVAGSAGMAASHAPACGPAWERSNARSLGRTAGSRTCSRKEKMILNGIRPNINPQLDECQAGFRWGSDVQAYALLETLTLRKHTRTFCAFLGIRKAWSDAAMLRLRRAGVTDDLWHLVDDFVTNRTAAIRMGSHTSDHWEVEDGMGQGAVLSGFLFSILINRLAAAIKRACNGVSCDSDDNSLRVKVLLYADDVVILCENAADLQRALDAARFHFGIGPSNSAVMVFGNTGSRSRVPPFFLSGQALPRVKSYPYLGIVFHEKLHWKPHVDYLLKRGECKMAACLSWTNAENLPVSFVDRIFQTYVRPSACFGLEFLTDGSQLKRFQTRLLQWGERLHMWPQGAPGIVVQGQLAWHNANTMRLTQAASLWARLLSLPHSCFAAQLARFATAHSRSWLSSLDSELSAAGVQHPFNWGIHAGCSQQLVTQWLSSVKQILHAKFCADYVQEVRSRQSLGNFLLWQPNPHLHPGGWAC